MLKVLWYSDFLVPTGFGNVAEEIISRLQGRFDFTVFGINYRGEPYNHPDSPYYRFKDIPVYPAESGGDPLGRGKLIDMLDAGEYDVLFVLQDTFNLVPPNDALKRVRTKKEFKYILYFPVDGPLDPLWVTNAIDTPDVAVAYTEYGREEAKKYSDRDVHVLYHGVDTEVFKPTTANRRKKIRRELFGVGPDDFLITNVNRNQPRKDLPRTIIAWLEVQKSIPAAKLYLHFDPDEQISENILRFVVRHVPKKQQDNIFYPESVGPNGVDKSTMRDIYCASDVVVSTTMGEGWGLSITESLACKVPVVMPRHTSCEEILGKDQERGWLAECTSFVVLPEYDNSQLRPLTDVDSLVGQILSVYNNPKEARRRSKNAYDWVKEYCDWNRIADSWAQLLQT